jgi:Calx-beta domain
MSGSVRGAKLPELWIASDQSAHVEGDTGEVLFGFTVTRTGDLTGTSSATWTVLAGDTLPADYVGGVLPSGNISFDIGVNTAAISVPVAGDTVFEQDEGFSVQLSNPVGCTINTAVASSIIVNEPAHYVPAAAQHVAVTVEPRDINAPPSHDNCWIKQMFITSWRIAGAPETPTALLLETPATNAWMGHVGPDGSVLKPGGQWFPSVQALQEAYLERWEELFAEGQLPDSRMSLRIGKVEE